MEHSSHHSIWKGALIGGAALGAVGAALAGVGSNLIEEIVLMPEAEGLMSHLAGTLNATKPPLSAELLEELKGIVAIRPFSPDMPLPGEGVRQFLVPMPENFLNEYMKGLTQTPLPVSMSVQTLPPLAAVNVVQGAEISPELHAALGPYGDHLRALTQADKVLPPTQAAMFGGVAGASTGAAGGALIQLARNAFGSKAPKPVMGQRTAALVQERQQAALLPGQTPPR